MRVYEQTRMTLMRSHPDLVGAWHSEHQKCDEYARRHFPCLSSNPTPNHFMSTVHRGRGAENKSSDHRPIRGRGPSVLFQCKVGDVRQVNDWRVPCSDFLCRAIQRKWERKKRKERNRMILGEIMKAGD